VENYSSDKVSVIDTGTNNVIVNVNVGNNLHEVSNIPDGTKVYAEDWSSKNINHSKI
jgi:DNA-binding beta-propeller fold protein YncE